MGTRLSRDLKDNLIMLLGGRIKPTEIASSLNYQLRSVLDAAGIPTVFIGPYEVNVHPEDRNQMCTRLFTHQGTEACSPIPITGGIIGRAVRTARDQYIPDVTKDPDHHTCDPTARTELVLVNLSEPYAANGRFPDLAGQRVPLGVMDIDCVAIDALTMGDVGILQEVWREFGPKIFPGQAIYRPRGGLYVGKRRSSKGIFVGEGRLIAA